MGEPNMIWVVRGSTGEYSVLKEWFYRAYEDESEARAEVERLNDKLRELGVHYEMRTVEHEKRERATTIMRRDFDPNFSCQYTGTEYRRGGPVELVRAKKETDEHG